MEDLHGYLLPSVVLCLEHGVVNGDVLLDVALRELNLLILARPIHAHECPVGHGNGPAENQSQEEVGLEATTVEKREDTLDKPWYDDNEGSKVDVVEGPIAIVETLYGRILDGRGISLAESVVGHHCDGGRS